MAPRCGCTFAEATPVRTFLFLCLFFLGRERERERQTRTCGLAVPVEEVEECGSSSVQTVLRQVRDHVIQHRQNAAKVPGLRPLGRMDKMYYLLLEPWEGCTKEMSALLEV